MFEGRRWQAFQFEYENLFDFGINKKIGMDRNIEIQFGLPLVCIFNIFGTFP